LRPEIFAMPNDGLITIPSEQDFATTLERLVAAIDQRRITIFSRIDHAMGAASAGLMLRQTTVIIFGNPLAGTPLMQAGQKAAIDLPLKALVWQDADGTVKLTYNDPAWIASRHHLDTSTEPSVKTMTNLLDDLAHAATRG
jgi:uncharacterized protein (DUF302 family)